jgi:AAA domain
MSIIRCSFERFGVFEGGDPILRDAAHPPPTPWSALYSELLKDYNYCWSIIPDKPMSEIFHRRPLAEEMAAQLLRPGVLDQALRSGLFLSGVRRIGKTTFLKQDLIPALETDGAIVIYVDLWSDTSVSPSVLLQRAVRAKLGESGGVTLADAFTEVVEQSRTDLVVIVDEVQQCLASDDGLSMMLALKAARDAINLRPNPPGHFVFIGTGSNRALVQELSARRNMAFQGAQSLPYPVLSDDFVAHVLTRLRLQGSKGAPSHAVAAQAFKDLGSRPEELLNALRVLAYSLPAGAGPDATLQIIVATVRAGIANAELVRIQEIGLLAEVIFDRIASSQETQTRGIYSTEAMDEYSKELGRRVRSEEIQNVVQQLQGANIIMRLGHGAYTAVDPFVREMWLERKAQLAASDPS